jgi:hypothetical protein
MNILPRKKHITANKAGRVKVTALCRKLAKRAHGYIDRAGI